MDTQEMSGASNWINAFAVSILIWATVIAGLSML
jgi:hypothetical protein